MRTLGRTVRSSTALAAALITGVGIPIAAASFLRNGTIINFWQGAILAGAISGGTILALTAERKALLVWWSTLLLMWMWLVVTALLDGDLHLLQAARFLPERFAFWSVLAWPSFLATMLLLWKQMTLRGWMSVVGVAFFWGILAAASGYIASIALDVGGTPLEDPARALAFATPAFLIPFVCCSLVIGFVRGSHTADR